MRAIIPERYRRGIVRALVVSNMRPDAAPSRARALRPRPGAALRRLGGLEVELYEFPPGARALAAAAARELRRRYGAARALRRRARPLRPDRLAGARGRARACGPDHARHRRAPSAHAPATRAVLPLIDLLAAVSRGARRSELPGAPRAPRAQVLPCGVDIERFQPIPRAQARAELGLDPDSALPAVPRRSGARRKRYDRALGARAPLPSAELLTLGGVDPERVPLWINAANAVLVPSEREGFGLAVLEAFACDVPVLATPVGIHPRRSRARGARSAPRSSSRAGGRRSSRTSRAADPRVAGRARAERFSADGAWPSGRVAALASEALQDASGVDGAG